MPGMSKGFHAKMSVFLHRNSMRDASNSGGRLALMRMTLLGYSVEVGSDAHDHLGVIY